MDRGAWQRATMRSMGLQRVGHEWAINNNNLYRYTFVLYLCPFSQSGKKVKIFRRVRLVFRRTRREEINRNLKKQRRNNRSVCLKALEASSLKLSCQQDYVHSETSGATSCLSPCFWGFVSILGGPQLRAAISASIVIWYLLCMCLCLCVSCCYKDISHIGVGPMLLQYNLIKKLFLILLKYSWFTMSC